MNRTIKFKLKNGKVVAIRRLKPDDYDAYMKFFKEFSSGPGAKWTWNYPGRPRKKEKMVEGWSDNNHLFIAAFDGNKIVGTASIHKKMPEHPWSGRTATTGTAILEKYTSNGLGNKFKQIIDKWARENNVHKLQGEVSHKNIRSLNNILKQGYEIVGILHDTKFVDGEWQHEYIVEKILEK